MCSFRRKRPAPSRIPDAPPADAAAEPEALVDAHLKAVAYIEARLYEPMTVKSIAEQAGFSPSRFSRGFTRLQGESVMAYVRGRRLEGAMRRMLVEPGVRIIDLALECGFDSQAAFTRAFVRAYGHPPGRLRSLGPVRSVVRARRNSRSGLEIHERVERVPELRLAGLAKRFTPANYVEMPALWHNLDAARGFDGQMGDEVYAVRRKVYPHDGGFDFVAALRIEPAAEPPAGLEPLTLASRNHVVFRHVLRHGDIYPQITAAHEAIRTDYLRASGHTVANAPCFELYPRGLDLRAGGWIDYYFPIMESAL